VHDTLQRANGHSGTGTLTAAINAYEPRNLRTRSDLERAFLQLCEKTGLPRPQVNTRVAGYKVDAVWPDQRLVVELDAYWTRGSATVLPSDRRRDPLRGARPRAVHRAGLALGGGADAGVHERRGRPQDARDRRDALLEPLARRALAQGRDVGQHAGAQGPAP